MTPTLAIAALGAAATGEASAVAHLLPPGIKVALAHIPSWSHAY